MRCHGGGIIDVVRLVRFCHVNEFDRCHGKVFISKMSVKISSISVPTLPDLYCACVII